MEIRPIAHIRTDFPEKFGIPRQSNLVDGLIGRIIFEPEFRNPEALRGLQGFSYLWLIWQFEGTSREGFNATVRPPRLGGSERMGVFATRSPYRPNPLGLSSVKLVGIERDEKYGPVIVVEGADLRDNTPVFDIKPYLPYADIHEDAQGGFTNETSQYELEVEFDAALLDKVPVDRRKVLIDLLKQDPRSAYRRKDGEESGMAFAGMNIRFCVDNGTLKVLGVEEYAKTVI